MRITPVTGDLPALVTPPPPPVRQLTGAPTSPATAPVEQTTATDTGADAAAGGYRPPALKAYFDPPLIAQRAALGLPTGLLIADLARAEGIPYAAAVAAVDRLLPRDAG